MVAGSEWCSTSFLRFKRQGTVMRTIGNGTAARLFVLGTLVVSATWAVATGAAGSGGSIQAEPQAAQTTQANGDKAPAPEKKFAFEMRDKPWNTVLEWLADNSGMQVSTTNKPQGTFTFINPKHAQYTIPEVVDILNNALVHQNY